MANRSVRKSQLIAFNNVAAGHDGVLSNRSGEIVVKPCKQSEIDFYETISKHPDFALYIPAYLGTLSLSDGHSAQVAGAIVLPADTSPEFPSQATFGNETVIENAWTPSNGGKIQTDLAIVLENVAVDYKKPNILDVKLGARLWADDAPPAKRARLDKAAEETTSKPLGFRIAGAKAYHGPGSENKNGATPDGYKLFDKNYGRRFNVDNVRQGFEDYFLLASGTNAQGNAKYVVKRFIEDLTGMVKVLENEESRMYSASLLFVYEGDAQALDDAFIKEEEILYAYANDDAHGSEGRLRSAEAEDTESEGSDEDVKPPSIHSLKLIDFAHAQWTPGLGPDENILHGIRNVCKILAEIVG